MRVLLPFVDVLIMLIVLSVMITGRNSTDELVIEGSDPYCLYAEESWTSNDLITAKGEITLFGRSMEVVYKQELNDSGLVILRCNGNSYIFIIRKPTDYVSDEI